MGCFKITWNIFNLSYSISALVFAFQSPNDPLRVLSVAIFSLHIFFTITLNALTAKDINESTHSVECYLLLQNCIVLLLTALLLIFTAHSQLIFSALPILCYISLLHIICLCVACLSQKGYRFLQIFCQRKYCCHRCESDQKNSSCLRKFARLEDCLTTIITCACCCKPKRKIKKRGTLVLKEQLRKNLPRSSIGSKQSDISLASSKKSQSKDSSNYLQAVKKRKKRNSHRQSEQSIDKIIVVTPNHDEQKLHTTAKISPNRSLQFDNSFTSLPQREDSRSNISIMLMEYSQHAKTYEEFSPTSKGQGKQFEALMKCKICEQPIERDEKIGVIPQCKHIFHSNCVRRYAKEQGERECAECGIRYQIVWYKSTT